MTVFGERFRCEFSDDALVATGLVDTPIYYTIRFRFPDYTGAVTILGPTSEPFTLDIDGSQEDRFGAIYPGKATFSMLSNTGWNPQDLLPTDDQQVQVVVEATQEGITRVAWIGWVQPTDIQELYAEPPYPVNVRATCGLQLLKDRLLVDATGKRLTGRPTVIDVVLASLALTRHGIPVTTAVNFYEAYNLAVGQTVEGKANWALDPLGQVKLNAESLITESSETVSAYDAMEQLLTSFGCRIAQADGDWVIVRANEAAGGWDVWPGGTGRTIVTRRYNPAYIPGGVSSQDLTVNIGITRNVRATTGSQLWGLPIKQAVTISQKFGGYLDYLLNGNFSAVAGGMPTNWSRINLRADEVTPLGTGTEADPFRVRVYGSGTNEVRVDFRAIRQQLPLPAAFRTRSFRLRGRFRLTNVRSAMLWITARVGGTQPVLQSDGTWLVNPPRKKMVTIVIQHAYQVPGKREFEDGWLREKPGWCDIDIPMQPLAGATEMLLNLCAAEALDGQTNNPPPYIEYADMRLEAVEVGQQLDGLTAQKKTSADRKQAQASATLEYGDVPDAAGGGQRLGTLFKFPAGDFPTTLWYPGNGNILTNPGAGKTLIDWILQERSAQVMKPAGVFQGTLIGRLRWGMHSILRFDDIVKDGQPIPFQITRYRWLARSGRHTVMAVEVLKAPVASGVSKKSWDTPDGPIDWQEDATGILPPTLIGGLKSFLERVKDILNGLGVQTPAVAVPELPGHAVTEPGGPIIGADIYEGSVRIGRVVSVYRQQEELPADS